MFWFDYNGKRNIDFEGLQVVQRPNIPQPKKRVTYIDIVGRDGSLTETDGTYENIELSVDMNFLTPRYESFMNLSRQIKNWLIGSGELKFSDDIDVFYKVKNAMVSENIERALKRAGFFTALFTCDPFTYFVSGKNKSSIIDASINPYLLSKPVYYITGEGNAILTVNGNSVEANIGQNLIIDTDLQLIYREDKTYQKTITRCIYPDFYLKPGVNSISITNGFDLKIQTNWRTL